MAELLGKRPGCARARAARCTLPTSRSGSLGESGIVASALPVAAGAGLSARIRRTDQVCLCFFGDGAANEGAFHESLNLAAIWKLPVIFLCENNVYAVSRPSPRPPTWLTSRSGALATASRAWSSMDKTSSRCTSPFGPRWNGPRRRGTDPRRGEDVPVRAHAAGLVFGETRPQEEIDAVDGEGSDRPPPHAPARRRRRVRRSS